MHRINIRLVNGQDCCYRVLSYRIEDNCLCLKIYGGGTYKIFPLVNILFYEIEN